MGRVGLGDTDTTWWSSGGGYCQVSKNPVPLNLLIASLSKGGQQFRNLSLTWEAFTGCLELHFPVLKPNAQLEVSLLEEDKLYSLTLCFGIVSILNSNFYLKLNLEKKVFKFT